LIYQLLQFMDQGLTSYHYSSLVVLVGVTSLKCLRLSRLKSDQDEIWWDCSWSKYTL